MDTQKYVFVITESQPFQEPIFKGLYFNEDECLEYVKETYGETKEDIPSRNKKSIHNLMTLTGVTKFIRILKYEIP